MSSDSNANSRRLSCSEVTLLEVNLSSEFQGCFHMTSQHRLFIPQSFSRRNDFQATSLLLN
ncbi:hypothetical protein J6590_096577, partial [Homalodisca vitripennis]